MKVLKFIKWLIKSIVLGLAIILIFNIVGSYFNLNVPLNIYTLLITSFLRIPGLVAILIFQLL